MYNLFRQFNNQYLILFYLESIAAVCSFYPKGSCSKGALCPMRHVRGDRTVVCKHWLRGLCKKGDQCEFLHEYDMTKMPECYFYARFSKIQYSLFYIILILYTSVMLENYLLLF